jgi:hypothetical protein
MTMALSTSEEKALVDLLDQHEIRLLIQEYPKRYHARDMKGVGELFGDALVRMRVRDEPDDGRVESDAKLLQELFEGATIFYEDGETYTRIHACQSEINVGEDRESAESTTYYIATQAVPDSFPLQMIVVGEWQDKFKRVDGTWRFSERCFARLQVGDESAHMSPAGS